MVIGSDYSIGLNPFVNQAVKLGEKSKQAFTMDLGRGDLGTCKVGFFTKRTTKFKAANLWAWNEFRDGLKTSFGENALPPGFNRMVEKGKPLTARTVIQFTRQAQDAARGAVINELSAILDGADSRDKAYLLSHSTTELLDVYISVKEKPGFGKNSQGIKTSPAEQQAMLAYVLRMKETRPIDFVGDTTAVGLTGLTDGPTFGPDETSVEDLTKLPHGALRSGDGIGRISRGDGNVSYRYLFVKLKDKGVEPGFLVTKNWLPSHDQALRGESGEDNPLFRMGCERAEEKVRAILGGAGSREDVLRLWCAIADTYDVGDERTRIIQTAMPEGADLARLLERIPPAKIQAVARMVLGNPAMACHEELTADAKLYIRGHLPEFTEKHVIKLDYNESDRIKLTHRMRLPKRIKQSHGRFFRFFRTVKIREANRGAVAESLANDITRAIGVPAQTLKIVQGKYQDGSPKLMLDSTFISGRDGVAYRDFDHFIRDGYLDKDLLKATGHPGTIRDLGKHKAAFLLLGDRDAVGSKGQNKGFVGSSFAAIDPGHSLEGTRVDVNDDFSFSYKLPSRFTSGFKNFTVFDDSLLSEKMAGWDEIERNFAKGDIDAIFDSYKAQFGGQPDGDPNLDFLAQINEMRIEFQRRYNAMQKTLGPRLEIYRGRPDDAPGFGPRLLDTLENVEKLCSETSSTSPNGKVRLEHLRVSKRVAWDMTRDESGITLSCRDQGGAAAMMKLVENFLKTKLGDEYQLPKEDGKVVIPNDQIEAFMGALTEGNVRSFKDRV